MTESKNLSLINGLESVSKHLIASINFEHSRLNIDLIEFLISINQFVHQSDDEVIALIRENAPTFIEYYSGVMLRDIEEFVPHGHDKGRAK